MKGMKADYIWDSNNFVDEYLDFTTNLVHNII